MIFNQIFCSDTLKTLKTLPSNCVDLGITSPPYNKREKNNGGLVKKVIYSTYKDSVPERKYQSNQVQVLNEIYRATKEGGSFFYNHKLRYLNGQMIHPMDWLRKTDWLLKQEIIWDRTIAANIRGWRFWQVEERIYWLYKPINKQAIGKELNSKHAKLTSIWRAAPENHNPHPAPFPLWLPTRIILSVLNQRGVVLDPYIGSGTVGVAAKLLGHDYLGIDIDKNYCADAKQRIEQAHLEQDIIDREKALHVVSKTYQERKESKRLKSLEYTVLDTNL